MAWGLLPVEKFGWTHWILSSPTRKAEIILCSFFQLCFLWFCNCPQSFLAKSGNSSIFIATALSLKMLPHQCPSRRTSWNNRMPMRASFLSKLAGASHSGRWCTSPVTHAPASLVEPNCLPCLSNGRSVNTVIRNIKAIKMSIQA